MQSKADNANYLKNKKQAARFLGVSEASLERLMRRHGLPFIRVGCLVKFRPEDLTSFIEERRIQRPVVETARA